MQFNSDTPRRDVTIAGTVFQIPAPYVAGHPLTVGEASGMNQLLSENIRNNMQKTVADAITAGKTQADIQADIDKYVSEYEFGVRSSRGPVDPVASEARKIVLKALADYFKGKGEDFSKFDAERKESLIATALERNPSVLADARKIVDTRKKTAAKVLSMGD